MSSANTVGRNSLRTVDGDCLVLRAIKRDMRSEKFGAVSEKL